MCSSQSLPSIVWSWTSLAPLDKSQRSEETIKCRIVRIAYALHSGYCWPCPNDGSALANRAMLMRVHLATTLTSGTSFIDGCLSPLLPNCAAMSKVSPWHDWVWRIPCILFVEKMKWKGRYWLNSLDTH